MPYKPSKQSDDVTETIIEWYENLPEDDRNKIDEMATLITINCTPPGLRTHRLNRMGAIEILGKIMILIGSTNNGTTKS